MSNFKTTLVGLLMEVTMKISIFSWLEGVSNEIFLVIKIIDIIKVEMEAVIIKIKMVTA